MSVNGLDKAGSTPVHWAAHGGHIECVQRLLAVPNCEIDVQVCTVRFNSCHFVVQILMYDMNEPY